MAGRARVGKGQSPGCERTPDQPDGFRANAVQLQQVGLLYPGELLQAGDAGRTERPQGGLSQAGGQVVPRLVVLRICHIGAS